MNNRFYIMNRLNNLDKKNCKELGLIIADAYFQMQDLKIKMDDPKYPFKAYLERKLGDLEYNISINLDKEKLDTLFELTKDDEVPFEEIYNEVIRGLIFYKQRRLDHYD